MGLDAEELKVALHAALGDAALSRTAWRTLQVEPSQGFLCRALRINRATRSSLISAAGRAAAHRTALGCDSAESAAATRPRSRP